MKKLESSDIQKMEHTFGKIQTASLLLAEKMRQMISLIHNHDDLTIADLQTLQKLHRRMEANEIFISAKLDEIKTVLHEDASILKVRESFDKWTREFEALVRTQLPSNYLIKSDQL